MYIVKVLWYGRRGKEEPMPTRYNDHDCLMFVMQGDATRVFSVFDLPDNKGALDEYVGTRLTSYNLCDHQGDLSDYCALITYGTAKYFFYVRVQEEDNRRIARMFFGETLMPDMVEKLRAWRENSETEAALRNKDVAGAHALESFKRVLERTGIIMAHGLPEHAYFRIAPAR